MCAHRVFQPIDVRGFVVQCHIGIKIVEAQALRYGIRDEVISADRRTWPWKRSRMRRGFERTTRQQIKTAAHWTYAEAIENLVIVAVFGEIIIASIVKRLIPIHVFAHVASNVRIECGTQASRGIDEVVVEREPTNLPPKRSIVETRISANFKVMRPTIQNLDAKIRGKNKISVQKNAHPIVAALISCCEVVPFACRQQWA